MADVFLAACAIKFNSIMLITNTSSMKDNFRAFLELHLLAYFISSNFLLFWFKILIFHIQVHALMSVLCNLTMSVLSVFLSTNSSTSLYIKLAYCCQFDKVIQLHPQLSIMLRCTVINTFLSFAGQIWPVELQYHTNSYTYFFFKSSPWVDFCTTSFTYLESRLP